MNLKYRIIEIYPETHSIVVRYSTNIATEESLATIHDLRADGTPFRCRSDVVITLPIPEPSAEELDKIIVQNAPIKGLKDVELILDANVNTSLSTSMSLLGIVKEVEIVDSVPTDEEINNVIASLSDQ